MSTFDSILEDMEPIVYTVAREYRRKFPMVELEDLRQELWLEVGSKADRFHEWLGEGKYGLGKCYRTLRRTAAAFCQIEKAQKLGYELDTLVFYTIGQLTELLPAVYDTEQWVYGQAMDDNPGAPRNPRPLHEGGERVATLSDVSRALSQLPREDQALLEYHFGLGTPYVEIAYMLETTEDAIRLRFQRLLRRLQEILGGPRPSFEGRHAISNAEAQAKTRALE